MTIGPKKKSWFSMRVLSGDGVDPNQTVPADGKAGEIMVYDEIGAWGVSASDFDRSLKALGDVKTITMRVNSPGGDSFTGIAIHNTIKKHPATVTAHVDGLAASAASLITMAADKIVMPENAFMVVHEPHAMTYGPESAHRAMADDLGRISDAYANAYAARTGQTVENVKSLMAEDRLMGAKECKEKGYADDCVAPAQMAAAYSLDKVPEKHRATVASVLAPAANDNAEAQEAARVAFIRDTGVQAKADQAFTDAHVQAGTTKKEFRKALLAKLLEPKAVPKAAAASEVESAAVAYGEADMSETLELCTIARQPIAAAQKFIAAKTPLAKVREALAAASADAADERVVIPVRVNDGGGANGTESSASIIANKRRLQKIIKLAESEKISEHEATLRVDAEMRGAA